MFKTKEKTPHVGVHPRTYTKEQKQDVIHWLSGKSLKDLRRRQDIAENQLVKAFKRVKNGDYNASNAYKDVYMMETMLTLAIDLKEFGE